MSSGRFFQARAAATGNALILLSTLVPENWTVCISSYLYFDKYKLHKNSQKYTKMFIGEYGIFSTRCK